MLSRPVTHGRPGTSARRLSRRRTVGAFAVLACGLLIGLLLALSGLPLPGLLAVAVGWVASRWLRSRSGRAEAGAEGEVRTAQHLRRLRAAAVVYNARLPGRRGDVDMVVLGPMAAAVEIKWGRGRMSWYSDGQVRVGGRTLPGHPLRQAVAQAASTRRALALEGHVDAVLCVTDMRQRPRRAYVGDVLVWVTSARHLRRVLHRLPRQISRDEGRRLAAMLRS